MNILDDVLDTLDLKATIYFRTDFSEPWAVTVPELENAARFHLVMQGRCHVRFPSGDNQLLSPGDMILIPKGRSHILSDTADRPSDTLEDVLAKNNSAENGVLAIGEGDQTAATQMLCGHFMFREGADHPLLRSLPEQIMVTNATRAEQPWLDDVLRLITRHAFSGEVNSATALRRLSEVVFIELLRYGIKRSPELMSIISGLQDQQISRALRLMHRDPAYPWTVSKLAGRVAMSRSRFAERFSNLMGIGPMAYLTEWRLQKALVLVNQSQRSIQQIAQQTGYQSAAAFTRAFAGKFGLSPKRYRRKAA